MRGEQKRRITLSEEDIERIADAIIRKQKERSFYIDEEYHYNAHKRIDKLLDAYENATNIFMKTFIALVITGAIILAAIAVLKGWK